MCPHDGQQAQARNRSYSRSSSRGGGRKEALEERKPYSGWATECGRMLHGNRHRVAMRPGSNWPLWHRCQEGVNVARSGSRRRWCSERKPCWRCTSETITPATTQGQGQSCWSGSCCCLQIKLHCTCHSSHDKCQQRVQAMTQSS